MPPDKFLFSEHRPTLEDGLYTVEVSPVFTVDTTDKTNELFAKSDPPVKLEFEVQGEQYLLNPNLIDSVFPPAAAMGEYSDVLPHLILERSTLPWERTARKETDINKDAPWLCLLLFPESEAKNYSLAQLPANNFDTLSSSNDLISIISVSDPAFFTTALPSLENLRLLSHVRGEEGKETATIIGNRKPAPGEKNTVHLVSVEKCYGDNGNFNPGNTKLVSLYNWSFFCTEHFRFTGEVLDMHQSDLGDDLYNKINGDFRDQEFFSWDEFMKMAIDEDTKKSFTAARKKILDLFDLGRLVNILKHLDRGAVRNIAGDKGNGDAAIATAGYTNVSYTTKTGKQAAALYRGPLLPFTPVANQSMDFKSIKQAEGYFQTVSNASADYPDISYSSAWELGRLLCLQNKNVSVALFQWKRKYYQLQKDMENSKDHNFLPGGNNGLFEDMPGIVKNYIAGLINLKGIPFNYLVPDEAMLPFESIRFFCIDVKWIRCLIEGVFSIGRISGSDLDHDKKLWDKYFAGIIPQSYSGFIIRSVAVSGWPDLVIEPLPSQRKEDLSPDILIALYGPGEAAKEIYMYQRPEILHFDAGNEKVKMVNEDGKFEITFSNNKISIKPKDGQFSSPDLANQLIAGLGKVKFQIGG